MKSESFLLLLKKNLLKNGNKVALKFQDKEITYQELDEISDSISNHILKKCSEKDEIIAIAMKKGIEQIASIIGVMKAGKTYLPIDLSYPKERIKYIIENSNVNFVISTDLLADDIKNLNKQIKIIKFEEIEKTQKNQTDYTPTFAYAMYTSGSTGKPKGNLIKAEAASNLINWQIKQSEKFQNKKCITLQLAPISFDVSFQEIFSTLCIGGTLIIVDEETRIDFNKVSNIINNENITRVYMPPVYLNEIANISYKRNNCCW